MVWYCCDLPDGSIRSGAQQSAAMKILLIKSMVTVEDIISCQLTRER